MEYVSRGYDDGDGSRLMTQSEDPKRLQDLGLKWHFDMTEKYGHLARLDGGLIGNDALYVTDPAALNAILVRDHNLFQESTEFAGLFGIIHHGDGLASVWGDEHKRQRKLVDPIFTPTRISRLTPLFHNVVRQLQASLNADLADRPRGQEIDVLDRLVRTTLELIAQGGLGHTFNSFDHNSKEFKEFHWAITSVLPIGSRLFLFLPFLQSWRKMKPVWFRRLASNLVTYLPWSAPREFKKACDTMHPVYEKLLDGKKSLYREGGISALEESATSGKDLMTILFKSNWEARNEDRLSDEVVVANMGSVVHGAQETTSGALSRFVSLLALQPELQERLRAEILEARERKGNDGDFDYRELDSLPLLDAVCRETLRLFTPVTFVWRQTMKDTVIPLKYPIYDTTGAELRSLLVTKGTAVYLGLAAANRSKEIWGPDADEFKPERWMGKAGEELITQDGARLPGLYSNMMTFLELVLAVLLENYSFARSDKEIDWKLYITLTPYAQGVKEPCVPVKVTMLEKN
ncbi:hypothetical protein H0H93_009684 [Arthromyces matolae]|nr:hypothetical protein H0H93_009684 [Arthromyces matolae]